MSDLVKMVEEIMDVAKSRGIKIFGNRFEARKNDLCIKCLRTYETHGRFNDACPVELGEEVSLFEPLICGHIAAYGHGSATEQYECHEPATILLDADTARCAKHKGEA